MVGSGGAEVAVSEDRDQRKPTGRKRVKTPAEKDTHNKRCVKYRKNKKLRLEELEKTELKYNAVLPELEKIQAEYQMMIPKMQSLENESMELRAFMEQVANQEQMMRQIPTSWEFGGQKISSFEHCQDLVLSQKYEQVCQGTLSDPDSGFSFGANHNHDNNGLFIHDPAAGTLSNPGAGSSFGANHDLPVFDVDSNGLFTYDPADGSLF